MREENDVKLKDQGFKLHIFSFKTNHLFLVKNKVGLDELGDQTINMIKESKNDYVCFNA